MRRLQSYRGADGRGHCRARGLIAISFHDALPKTVRFGGQLLTEIRFKQTHIISDIGSPIPAPEHLPAQFFGEMASSRLMARSSASISV